MFRNLAVCTVVLVAVLSNDALALHQGNSYMPITGDDTKEPMDTPPTSTSATTPAVLTPDHEKTTPATQTGTTPLVPTTPVTSPSTTSTTGTKPLTVVPSVMTPTVEKGLHASDCNPNFPSEMPKETPKATPAATPVVVAPPPPMPVVVATPVQALTTPTNVADSTVSNNNEQTGQKANTQSGTQSGGSTTSTGAVLTVGAIAAVAAVGVAVSQVKKARDADTDAALVTPGENENIHIEIKNTPAGGSTIL